MEEDGKYTLGDDALACLKDLRMWLKLYDEKMNRYDVCAPLGLVRGWDKADAPVDRWQDV